MHGKSIDAMTAIPRPPKAPEAAPSACPVNHGQAQAPAPVSACPVNHGQAKEKPESKSFLSQINPLNYMFKEISQAPAANQSVALPTSRDPSSIPKGTGDGNWEYPSPQQMYNALLRKGHTDTDITAVESMVACHNFLNEGAWAEVVGWEDRFAKGLLHGFRVCSRGEENAPQMAYQEADGKEVPPTLVRFQGKPKEMSPKASMLQVMGWLYPSKFAYVPPDLLDFSTANHREQERAAVRPTRLVRHPQGRRHDPGDPLRH